MRTKYPLKEPIGMDFVTFGILAQVEVFAGQLWHYLEWVQVANLREQGSKSISINHFTKTPRMQYFYWLDPNFI